MGVDYSPIAGYGKEISEKDIREEFLEELEEEFDGNIYDFFEKKFKIDLDYSGSFYTGEHTYYYLIDDPLGIDFKKELAPLNATGVLKENIEPEDLEWVCDLLIH